MRNISNIIDKQFHRWTVFAYGGLTAHRHRRTLWKCQCNCGTVRFVPTRELVSGRSKSCGCLQREIVQVGGRKRYKDMSKQKFGRLTVLCSFGSDKHNERLWLCLCECGRQIVVRGVKLRQSRVRSCGCLRRDEARRRRIEDIVTNKFGTSKSCKLFLDGLSTNFGISIEREVPIDGRVFDGRFGGILIEVDGTYWHNKSKKIDDLKDVIALRNGYSLLRVSLNSISEVPMILQEQNKNFCKALFICQHKTVVPPK